MTHEFVVIDDEQYVLKNEALSKGLNAQSLTWAFSFDSGISYWHPLTWLSLLLDFQLFGQRPAGYHLVNVLLHAANAAILFHWLWRATADRFTSAFVAFLFAAHPLNVEAVAWAAERKTVLSGLFFMLAVSAYVRYAARPGAVRYSLVLLAMCLGLLAKPAVAFLPLVLLLLDYWPLKRIGFASAASSGGFLSQAETTRAARAAVVAEAFPLFVLGAASLVVTAISVGGELHGFDGREAAVGQRLADAVVSYVLYLWKSVWPLHLAVFYPRASHPAWLVAASAGLLVAASALALAVRRTRPWLSVGWFWFVAALLPASGVVRAGRWPAMADRFAYLALVGLLIMLSGEMAHLGRQARIPRALLTFSAASLVLLLATLAAGQVSVWKDSVTLLEHAVKVAPDGDFSHYCLGRALLERGSADRAIGHFQRALELDPFYFDAHLDLGVALAARGRPDEALRHYRAAALLKPADAQVQNNLGAALLDIGRAGEAIPHLRSATIANPDYATAHYNLGVALLRQGETREAAQAFARALKLRPYLEDARINLASTLVLLEETDRAIEELRRVLATNPAHATARLNLAKAYEKKGLLIPAIDEYRKVIALDPDNAEARQSLRAAMGISTRR